MIKHFVIYLLLASCSYCLADNNCQIKPVLKTYTAPDSKQYPVENKISTNLVISTPYPTTIVPLLPLYLYGTDKATAKTILFATDTLGTDGYDIKTINLKAFGALEVSPEETAIMAYRYKWISCQNLPIEINLNNPAYRAFLTAYTTPKDLYNLHIIPTDKRKLVYIVQFNKFSAHEVDQMLGTLKVLDSK